VAPGPDRAAPKNRRAAALPPEKRREAIVSATLPLLLEHGLAVTTRQIAEAAGVAEGTIFRVFADKDALIDAVFEKALDPGPVETRLAEIDPSLPLDERLVEAVRIMQERVAGVWRLVSSVGFTRPPEPGDDSRRRKFTDVRHLVALFEADRDRLRYDPASNAQRLRALAIAGSHPALIDRPLPPEEIVALFLDGVRLRPAATPPPAPDA
jgi:AcrR family transcriptional regulator